ncbi:MAG: leucine-rich repeat protein [Eubacteriales bacterium]|nr:leucine-rich repeat protein [Eubacteriales bacterium]
MKKLLSLVLCLTICITLCPANIFAEGIVEGIAEQSGDEYTVEYDEDPDILSDVIDYGDMISSEIPAVFGQESADMNTQAEPAMPEEGQCEEPAVEEVPSESSDPDSAVASGECGENIIWRLDKDGTLTFTGTGAIPDYLLKDNLMGAYYTSAPWGETHRFDVKKIVIGDGITRVGNTAFCGCAMLEEISMPDSMMEIGDWAFAYTDIVSISIPENVTTVGRYVFYQCNNLKEVTIPDSVTGIGNEAFSECVSLMRINVGEENTNYRSIDGVLFNKSATKLIIYPRQHGAEYTIPSGVTGIDDGTFSNCASLTTVEIPDSVISIGNEAFLSCTGLTGIEIPNSVTSIGSWAFCGCANISALVLPDGLTNIESYTFLGCSGLVEIKIPDGVKRIKGCSFDQCINLRSVTIPRSVSYVGNHVFSECLNLTDIYYAGIRSQWDTITIEQGNEPLTKAEIHCMGEEPAVPQFTLSNTDVTLTLGESVQLRAYLDGTDVTDTVTWTVTNIDVVQFSGGTLTGINYGTVIVTARYCVGGSDITAQCLINVIPQPISTLIITKDLPASYTASENEIVTLSIEACGGNGTLSFQWYSSSGPLSCTSPEITFRLSAPEVLWCVVTIGEQTVESTHCQLITVPESTPKFIVSDSGGNPGKTATVRVSIENNPGIVGLTVGFVYDSSLFTLRTITPAGLSGSWATGKKVTWASDRGDQFFNGTILDLEFEIADNAPLGTYPIGVSFNKGDICNDAVQPVGFTASSGSITVNSHIPGDVNGDGHVGTKDFMTLMQYCADKEGIVYDPNALDINNDGYVNTMDFITLMQYLAARI